MHRRSASQRGSTLPELMMVMVVLAILMSLLAFEFRSVIDEHVFVQSHVDAEEQARIAMARMSENIKQATVDISNFDPPQGPVISPASTPTSSIQYYQVSGLTPQSMPTSPSGAPIPCYNVVTIAYQTPAPQQTEGSVWQTVAPVGTPCPNSTTPPPVMVAENVESFDVSVVAKSALPAYQLNLTIKADSLLDNMWPGEYSVSETIVPLVYGVSQ